jgi:ATP-dependent Clp protease ATP-binding subunit ClpB
VSEAAYDYLAEIGYDPAFGARPMRRSIAREIVNPAAEVVISGKAGQGAVLQVDAGEGGLVLSVS